MMNCNRALSRSRLLLLLAFLAATPTSAQPEGMATVTKGSVTVNSCYDTTTSEVEWHVTFVSSGDDDDEMPYMAVGYRPTQDCRMVTVDGASEIVLLTSIASSGDAESFEAGNMTTATEGDVYFGVLPALADVNQNMATAIDETYESLVPLGDQDGFTLLEYSTELPIRIHYRQAMVRPDGDVPLMYAIGRGPALGLHQSQGCFQVNEFPVCSSVVAEDSSSGDVHKVSFFVSVALMCGTMMWDLV